MICFCKLLQHIREPPVRSKIQAVVGVWGGLGEVISLGFSRINARLRIVFHFVKLDILCEDLRQLLFSAFWRQNHLLDFPS